jgi:hypothetical protein
MGMKNAVGDDPFCNPDIIEEFSFNKKLTKKVSKKNLEIFLKNVLSTKIFGSENCFLKFFFSVLMQFKYKNFGLRFLPPPDF